jgi:hypothetical protein
MIIGWGRSGSTLVARYLSLLPRAITVGELREIWISGVEHNRKCGCGKEFHSCPFWLVVGEVAFGGWNTPEANLGVMLRKKLDRGYMIPRLLIDRASSNEDVLVYQALLGKLYKAISEVADADLIIDSSKLVSHALLSSRAEINLKLIHLVRDSRGVSYSWQKMTTRRDAARSSLADSHDILPRYGILAAGLRYLAYNGFAQLMTKFMLEYARLRYEDFVTEPRNQLVKVLDSLGLADAAISLPECDHEGYIHLGLSHTVDGNPVRFHADRLRINRDDEWIDSLGRWHSLVTSVLTAPLLIKYGYSLYPYRRSGHGL